MTQIAINTTTVPTTTAAAVNGLLGNLGVFNNQTAVTPVTSVQVEEVVAQAKTVTKAAGKKSAEVEHGPEFIAAKSQVDALATEYQRLKVEIFDRSDRALWQLLSNIYDIALTINRSNAKKEIKSALIKAINARNEKIATSAETEVVVVRYIFADVARQTRNNYAVVMQKAMAQCVDAGGLFGFLEEHKGIVNVVEFNFDREGTESAAEAKEAKKAQRKESGELAKRLFSALIKTEANTALMTAQVKGWALPDEEAAKLKEEDKQKPKYQAGEFVFFIAKPDAQTGAYNVMQGFQTNVEFETTLIQKFAELLKLSNSELTQLVEGLEDVSVANDTAIAHEEAMAA